MEAFLVFSLVFFVYHILLSVLTQVQGPERLRIVEQHAVWG